MASEFFANMRLEMRFHILRYFLYQYVSTEASFKKQRKTKTAIKGDTKNKKPTICSCDSNPGVLSGKRAFYPCTTSAEPRATVKRRHIAAYRSPRHKGLDPVWAWHSVHWCCGSCGHSPVLVHSSTMIPAVEKFTLSWPSQYLRIPYYWSLSRQEQQ